MKERLYCQRKMQKCIHYGFLQAAMNPPLGREEEIISSQNIDVHLCEGGGEMKIIILILCIIKVRQGTFTSRMLSW